MVALVGILRWICGVSALALLAFILWSILRAARLTGGKGRFYASES